MTLDDVDLTDLDRFTRGFPHEVFTRLRAEAPVWWHPPTPHAPGGEGFWVLSRHAEARRMLADPRAFSSEGAPGRAGGGPTLVDYGPDEGVGRMLNMMDPPAHTRFRRLVNEGFTPRMVAALEGRLRLRTLRILDAVADRGRCDFVTEVAAELPLQTIAEAMGIPQPDRHKLYDWANAWTDHEAGEDAGRSDRARMAAMEAVMFAAGLVEDKRKTPRPDILSRLVEAEIVGDDGEIKRLSEFELNLFFLLLITAGSETTRNAVACGLLALIERPGAYEDLAGRTGRRLATAVEELLRWTSPTAYNRRTATRDVEMRGEKIRAGDKVTYWQMSANRDEDVFADPFRLDLDREPNDHLAFGYGAHYCLGAELARLEMRVLFGELTRRFADFALAGDPEWMRTNKYTGLRRLPVRYRVKA